METNAKRAVERVAYRLSADDLATLRAVIRRHEQRLQGLDPAAMAGALAAAVFADVLADPHLAAALRRAVNADTIHRARRAHLN